MDDAVVASHEGLDADSYSGQTTCGRATLTNLLDECLRAVQRGPSQSSQTSEGRFRAAEHLLTEAREYVDAAFALLETGKPRASLAVSRWILQAALDLVCATSKQAEVDKELLRLRAEALRQWKNLFKGLATLYPDDAVYLSAQAECCRVARVELVGDKEPPLTKLEPRLKAALGPNGPVTHEQVYTLYRICCAAAHPALGSPQPQAVWWPKMAKFMAAASTFHLVAASYCLIGLDDADSMKTWWEGEVSPLLRTP